VNRAQALVGGIVLLTLSACGSALPAVVEALPEQVSGLEISEQSLAEDGRLAAALGDEGLQADAIAGHEARWGDDIRLVILRFEEVGLEEASRVARSLLGIGEVESALGVVANQTLFELTGPDVGGVAYQFAVSGDGSETLMYTIVAPTQADAEPIVHAIADASPPQP